jgi:CheY-like chemotaxis protein
LVLHELATNAAKYGALSAADGSLKLKWQAERDHLVLEWQERGGPPARAPSALGFGLTIVRSSIEDQLAGSVSLQWRTDGLNCTIKVPRTHVVKVEETAPAPRASGLNGQHLADSADAGLRQRRILVVEDEVLISMFLEDVLDDLGALVVGPVTNLKDGLGAIQGESLDGAILDLNLGGEHTYPIADALTARGVPFVFITGYDRDTIDRRYGGIPVLQKPIEADTLERVLVKNMLQRVA